MTSGALTRDEPVRAEARLPRLLEEGRETAAAEEEEEEEEAAALVAFDRTSKSRSWSVASSTSESSWSAVPLRRSEEAIAVPAEAAWRWAEGARVDRLIALAISLWARRWSADWSCFHCTCFWMEQPAPFPHRPWPAGPEGAPHYDQHGGGKGKERKARRAHTGHQPWCTSTTSRLSGSACLTLAGEAICDSVRAWVRVPRGHHRHAERPMASGG